MRQLLQRHTWVTYLVVGVFLLATSGATLSRMTCLSGGHSVVSLGAATDCCPDEGPRSAVPEVKAACCELAQVQGERDYYLPDRGYFLWVPAPAMQHAAVRVMLPVVLAEVDRSGSPPPPLSAPDRLAVLSVQRV
ncbi:MAG: hypothetical protein JNM62_03045 [Flavobacteriales bacterium]|nr:hypothetical protein [Flavobacteriales bacterium]